MGSSHRKAERVVGHDGIALEVRSTVDAFVWWWGRDDMAPVVCDKPVHAVENVSGHFSIDDRSQKSQLFPD